MLTNMIFRKVWPRFGFVDVLNILPISHKATKTELVANKVQSGLSSRAKHGGTVFSAISGSIKDLTTVPGSYNHLGP